MSGLLGGTPKVQQSQAAAAITIQQSAYGTPIYLLYGTNRIYGNLIWYGDFTSTQISQGGGKGGVIGGGGKGGGSGEYNYTASFDIGLCEGPIAAINNVYVSKQVTNLETLNGQIFVGTSGQSPPGYMTTNHPTQARGYTLLSHVFFPNFSLGTSSETPQFSFETSGLKVVGSGNQDASPDQVLIDFLGRCGLPSAYIDTFSSLATYCQAMGFYISPLFDQQRTAIDWLKEIMTTLNSEFVWLPSQGVLTAVPYGDTTTTANGVTYVPNFAPIYSLDDNDYLRDKDQDDPVSCTRNDLSDVYNQAPIEYVNRSDQYNVETYQAFDDGLVDVYGFRTAPTLRAHHITSAPEAQQMAQLWLNRQIYVRNTYTVKLPWNYILLDPLDILEINDANMGLVNALVRVVSIEEDEKDGELTFTLEEIPSAIAGNTVYPNFQPTRSTPNYNQSPGTINTPVFFETPLALEQAPNVVLNMGLSGSNPLWGGCQVWVSTDDTTFLSVAEFNGKSRMGALVAPLATFTQTILGGNNIDTSNVLSISMAESDGSLNNAATEADAVNLNTLCYVDGELIAFGNDALTGSNSYNLSYLNRGCYGSTIGAHAAGANFVRFDNSVFNYIVDQSRIGQTLYFKFLSFNVWGGAIQSLDEVQSYNYTVLGSALLTALANPAGLSVAYTGNIASLSWSAVQDIRYPIFYEIRQGTSFTNSQVVGRTTQTTFPVYGSGTYWVSALYFTPLGVAVYSSSPPSTSVTTPSIVANSLGSHTEETAWSGTLTNMVVSGSDIQLADATNALGISNILTTSNVLSGGTVIGSGSYEIPSGNIITSTYVAPLKVIVNWAIDGVSTIENILTEPNILTDSDILGAAYQVKVSATPQIQLSQNGGSTWGPWQNWVPGYYVGNAVNLQLLVMTTDTTINAVISDFSYEVDIASRTDTGTELTSASGLVSVNYPVTYNHTPIPQVTIQNSSSGDDVIISSITASGFQVEVVNGGSNVVRTVGWSITSW